MASKITDKLVRSLEPPKTGNRITYDTLVSGFGVRVTAKNSKSFILNYRNAAGRERRYTIGPYGIWSVAAARDEAKSLKRRVHRGGDPMGERQGEREAPTMKDLCTRYIEEHLPTKRPSSRENDLSQIRRLILPRFGSRKVADITREDIAKIHRSLLATPVAGNRHLALLSKLFNIAIEKEWIERNPVRGIKKYHEEARTRFLSQAEIARLADALAEYSNQTVANAIRFLLLTGARRGEVLAMKWTDIDFETAVWTKPASSTKQRRTHHLPLSAPAMELLAGMERKSDFVFPGRMPNTGLYDLKTAWRTIQRRAALPDVHLHDLRHTHAALLASAGMSLPIIGQLLGHSQPRTTARYSHFYDSPLREAVEKVGAVVSSAGKDKAKVIPLRKG